jgi:hypothetical protein
LDKRARRPPATAAKELFPVLTDFIGSRIDRHT